MKLAELPCYLRLVLTCLRELRSAEQSATLRSFAESASGILKTDKKKDPPNYIVVLSFLPGEDKCTWDHPLYSDEELINSAQMLALYHNTIFGWQGTEGLRELSNFDEINLMASKWKVYARNAAESLFDEFFIFPN